MHTLTRFPWPHIGQVVTIVTSVTSEQFQGVAGATVTRHIRHACHN